MQGRHTAGTPWVRSALMFLACLGRGMMHLGLIMYQNCLFCAAIILLKGAQKWCSEHSSKLPQNAKEKAAFKHMLKSWQRSAEGIPADVSIHSPAQAL